MIKLFDIYAVYKCDDWKSFNSMDIRSPIVITTSLQKLQRKLRNYFPDEVELQQDWSSIHADHSLINELNNLLTGVYIIGFQDGVDYNL